MLITMVDSKSYGKFVLHRCPYPEVLSELEGYDKISANDMLNSLTETFNYFAIYTRKNLVPTSSGPLSEKDLLSLFMANQKTTQTVLGIDDDCVLVSKSAFLSRPSQPAAPPEVPVSLNAFFVESDEQEALVNSISLVCMLPSFEGVEEAKHRLSFLLGVLTRKELTNQFLSRQIRHIMEEKGALKRRIKDLFTLNAKDSFHHEEIRVKILAREIESEAKQVRQKMQLFHMLGDYYESWQRGDNYGVSEEQGAWEGSIGRAMKMGSTPKNFRSELEHKTLVMLPPKLAELLPPALYSDRVRRLYDRVYASNSLSLKTVLERSNVSSAAEEVYHTAYFLLRNSLAVAVYPIHHPHSYNLFHLRDLPPKQVIDKFNHRIFPGKSLLEVVNPYSRYKLAKEEEETLKYLLLKEIVGEVKILIYRKWEGRDSWDQSKGEAWLQELLMNYNMTVMDLNYLLSVEPLARDPHLLHKITKFIKENSKEWGFYFVE